MGNLFVPISIAGANAPIAGWRRPARTVSVQTLGASAIPRVQYAQSSVTVLVRSISTVQVKTGLNVYLAPGNSLNGKSLVPLQDHLGRSGDAHLPESKGTDFVFPGLPLTIQIGVGRNHPVAMGSAFDREVPALGIKSDLGIFRYQIGIQVIPPNIG